jgi:23S rRNA pseudouridine1911/1915/1917 synthase
MFEGRSKKDLKRLVREGRVTVNGASIKDLFRPVNEGDSIECASGSGPARLHPNVDLLYEDDHLLVVEKDAGILTSGGVRGRSPTVEDVLKGYLQSRGFRVAPFPCHRLDRDVSGIILFAKKRRLAEKVRGNARAYLTARVYHALVEGTPEPPHGTIQSYLRDDEDKVVRPQGGGDSGKLSISHYRTVEKGKIYSVLEVRLETGRKNQIRAHLRQIGHPVAGDRKYGARTDPARRVCLHAAQLDVVHPVTGERLEFRSAPPPSFAHAVKVASEARASRQI